MKPFHGCLLDLDCMLYLYHWFLFLFPAHINWLCFVGQWCTVDSTSPCSLPWAAAREGSGSAAAAGLDVASSMTVIGSSGLWLRLPPRNCATTMVVVEMATSPLMIPSSSSTHSNTTNTEPSGYSARVVAEWGICTTARSPGHKGEPRSGEATGRHRWEEMAAASCTAAKSLAPLAVRSGLLLGVSSGVLAGNKPASTGEAPTRLHS
jgi:hypothetical protein